MTSPAVIAVVGAGPSGIYAAEALTRQSDLPVRVIVLDQLPVPYGLVRYGVAPDNTSIRSIRNTLETTLERDQVWFYGDVTMGRDVSMAQLRGVTDAVIYAYGASSDRRLGIPGEDLRGSIAAPELVSWYCGHPQMHPETGHQRDPIEELITSTQQAAVIGAGNVALDVARVLIKTGQEQATTDMADEVLAVLTDKQITDVHLLARRGPVQAAWTTKELRDLGKLNGVDLLLDPADFDFDETSAQQLAGSKLASRNVAVMREWLDRPVHDADRRVHFHFWTRPSMINPDRSRQRVGGLEVEHTELDAGGTLIGAGPAESIPSQLVVRSIGYRGLALDDLPYDPHNGRVPHDQGRVIRDGHDSAGEYVTGWIKRGPTGVIGTNKSDANETVRSLLADLADGTVAGGHDAGELGRLLAGQGVTPLRMADWHNIDAAEIARGNAGGRDRSTIVHRSELQAAARGSRRPAPSEEE
jgi:ferredoxin--NADP+ reductase